MSLEFKTVLVAGGGGYVGSALVPELLRAGYRVRVLDMFPFGKDFFDGIENRSNLELFEGDIRDPNVVQRAIRGSDAIIHLACISNDPSYELNPELSKTINFDSFGPFVDEALAAGVKRFIFASSSSVYGVKAIPNVTEDLALEPLTDYAKYKALCEQVLLDKKSPAMTALILRPATICGYAPRLRLDLTVNILTNHAVTNRVIKVFGGDQMRPNLHMRDMVRAYCLSLQWPAEKIDGKIFNVGFDNATVREIAEMVQKGVGSDVKIEVSESNDPRSYHISSAKILKELGFKPDFTIQDAVNDLVAAFKAGLIPNSMDDDRYYNVRTMKKNAL